MHDVRVEHREQRVEITVARGSEEGVDDLWLVGEVGVGSSAPSPHPAARTARELPYRDLRVRPSRAQRPLRGVRNRIHSGR
jgi:hypothetical protein